MKKLTFLLSGIMPFVLFAQSSKISDNLSMTSKILKSERKYALYLPAGYESSKRDYPVLYLLHGGGDDQTGWVQFGEVQAIADKAILDGSATLMIIVMPDANTGKRGYFNDIKGEWRYEDFFFTEFMPYIESTYRIRKERAYRAVAGLSMGGGGTFIYALHHPELFATACPLSAGTGVKTMEQAKKSAGADSLKFTSKQLEEYYNRNNALSLIQAMPDSLKTKVRWYMDCGDDDFLYEGNSEIHVAMRKKEIPHEYRVRDGAHNWTYWREALPEVLKFVTVGFHR